MLILSSKVFGIVPWEEEILILIKVQMISSLQKNKNSKAADSEGISASFLKIKPRTKKAL